MWKRSIARAYPDETGLILFASKSRLTRKERRRLSRLIRAIKRSTPLT